MQGCAGEVSAGAGMKEKEKDWWSIAGCIIARCPLQGVSLHFTLYNLSCIGRERLVLWLQGMG